MAASPFRDEVVAAAEAVGSAVMQLTEAMYPNARMQLEVRSTTKFKTEGVTTMVVEVWDNYADERINMIEVRV